MDRWNRILDCLSHSPRVTTGELSETLHYSQRTLRRDLKQLSDLGMVRLVRGGAVSTSRGGHASAQAPDGQRSMAMAVHRPYSRHTIAERGARQAIARTAANMVQPGMSVIIDDGETTTAMAAAMSDHACHVLTPSIHVLGHLITKRRISVHLPGGQVGSDGTIALTFDEDPVLLNFNARRAFLSAHALDGGQLLAGSSLEVYAKRRIIDRAAEVVLLADSGSLEMTAPLAVCGLGRIHTLITDDRARPERLQALRAHGIDVRIARAH